MTVETVDRSRAIEMRRSGASAASVEDGDGKGMKKVRSEADVRWMYYAKALTYLLAWSLVSGLIIILNNWILHYDHFPFPITITCLGQSFSGLFAAILVRGVGVVVAVSRRGGSGLLRARVIHLDAEDEHSDERRSLRGVEIEAELLVGRVVGERPQRADPVPARRRGQGTLHPGGLAPDRCVGTCGVARRERPTFRLAHDSLTTMTSSASPLSKHESTDHVA